MPNMIKHVGLYGEKKCVVLFREVPNESDNCLIILPDALDARQHDEFMQVVEGIEAQSATELADVLNRRQFSDGANMLSTLHYSKKIQKVPTVNVDLTPVPNQRFKLSEVNDAIRQQQAGNPPAKTDPSHLAEDKPWIERSAEEATEYNQKNQAVDTQTLATTTDGSDPSELAISLLTQAELIKGDAEAMIRDAEAKMKQAYELDPSLKPKKRGRQPKTAS